MVDQENALVPGGDMAKLTITYGGQQGDLPDLVEFDSRDEDLKRIAEESIRAGYVPGIDAMDANFNDFMVDRYRARDDIPFNRISIRPKTPFGNEAWWANYLAPLIGGEITEVGIKADRKGLWPTLKVRLKESDEVLTLEISKDPEGNGPGFIFGLALPDVDELTDGSNVELVDEEDDEG